MHFTSNDHIGNRRYIINRVNHNRLLTKRKNRANQFKRSYIENLSNQEILPALRVATGKTGHTSIHHYNSRIITFST